VPFSEYEEVQGEQLAEIVEIRVAHIEGASIALPIFMRILSLTQMLSLDGIKGTYLLEYLQGSRGAWGHCAKVRSFIPETRSMLGECRSKQHKNICNLKSIWYLLEESVVSHEILTYKNGSKYGDYSPKCSFKKGRGKETK